MISSVGPSFTGRIPVKPSKTVNNAVKEVCKNVEKPTNIQPKESLGKRILSDMLYGLEMLADTFKLKI